MKQALAFALSLALVACSDKARLAPVAESAAPKSIALQPDKELAQRVARAIEGAKLRGIDVAATDGVVTLRGSTSSAKERSRAVQAAAKVEGVKAVENLLDVVSGS